MPAARAFAGNRVGRLATLVLAIGAASCSKPQPPAPQIREVGYVVLQEKPVTLTSDLPGRTTPYAVAEVRPQISGIVQKRLFTEGATVALGQPLYQIDPATYIAARDQAQAALSAAEANAASARVKADRYATLKGTDAVSKQDADNVAAAAQQAEAAVQQAKAALKTAEINLGYTRIVAPIAGKIGRSSVTAGALVTANQATALTTIWRLDPIYVDITQSATQLSQMRRAIAAGHVTPAGAEVTLTLDDRSAYPHTGKIEFSEAQVDEATGAVTIRATVPNPEGILLPGLFVRVTVGQGVIAQGILAPQQAITRDNTGAAAAFVVGEDNKIQPRKVQADRAIGDEWLITAGLKAGDRLVVEGGDRVRPGATVKPVAVDLHKVAARTIASPSPGGPPAAAPNPPQSDAERPAAPESNKDGQAAPGAR